MGINKKCDSRTTLKNVESESIASNEENKRNKNIKRIVKKIYARCIVYIFVFAIGFVIVINLGKIVSLILTCPIIVLPLKFIIEKIMKKKYGINEFLVKCSIVLAISSIVGGCVLHLHLDENLSAAFCAFKDPSKVNNTDSYKPLDEKPDMLEPKKLNVKEQEWLKKQNPNLLDIFNHMLVTHADYEYASENILSKDISNRIFFLGGQYKIDAWDNEEEILSKVSCLTKDKRKEKNENVFDRKADESQKGEINDISNREKKNRGENVWTSERLDGTNIRTNFYSTMPKASLALLIANDYHLFALIAFYYGYPDNVIIYYYAKSIEYQLEYISFKEVSDETVKQKLIWISTRYKDIVFTCNDGLEASLAGKLAHAFKSLSSEY